MKSTVNFTDFYNAFRDMDRQDQFSYSGKQALFNYLEQLGDDIGVQIELDVIALCCEYTEYEDLEEFHSVYNKEDYETIEDIEQVTTVIRIDDESFIIADF